MHLIQPVYAADLTSQYAFGGIRTLSQGVGLLMGPAFTIATIAVFFYFVIGAFRWLMSGGDKNAIQGAQNMITHAIIGFVILMMIFVIVQFVFQVFGIKPILF